MNNQSSSEEARAIARLDSLAKVLDSKFKIPGTDIRFGIESLIGVFPVFGDTISLFLNIFVVVLIAKQGVSVPVLIRICINVLIDFTLGLIPVFGDVADIFFKANIRNVTLAKKYYATPRKVNVQSNLYIGAVFLVFAFFIVGIFAAVVWLVKQIFYYSP